MRVLLFGYPLDHSLSPRFQNAAFKALGLDIRYELCSIASFDRQTVRALLDSTDVLGANVTVPHKESAITAADRLTSSARRVGAVNTFFKAQLESSRSGAMRAHEIIGDNTDLGGFSDDLSELGLANSLDAAVVLGAGGASRAVLTELAERTHRVAVVNRTLERARRVVAEITATLPPSSLFTAHAFPNDPGSDHELDGVIAAADLVVDTTSLGQGLSADDPLFASAAELLTALQLNRARHDALFYDLKYGAISPFLAVANELGARTSDGLGMLIRQGALAFERWTGQTPPLDVMLRALQ